ncbi:hypothetical protein LCGC14_2464980 [marine sediment metagenome]|uniref:Uncharacterized protein n=1 Tax=marine sediment metagenome TaxID=412755 RepID=A0A0F9DPA8_9ZZZZ
MVFNRKDIKMVTMICGAAIRPVQKSRSTNDGFVPNKKQDKWAAKECKRRKQIIREATYAISTQFGLKYVLRGGY